MFTDTEFKIETEDDARWFGLSITDACIFTRKDTGYLNYAFVSTDVDLAEFVSNYLGVTYHVVMNSEENSNHRDSYIVTKQAKWLKSVQDMGLRVNRANFNPEDIDLPEHLERAFVLGCWDGDGCLQISKNKNRPMMYTKFTKTEPIVRYITELIFKNTGIAPPPLCHNGPKNGSKESKQAVYYCKRAMDILDWLYEGNPKCGERKFNIYKQMIEKFGPGYSFVLNKHKVLHKENRYMNDEEMCNFLLQRETKKKEKRRLKIKAKRELLKNRLMEPFDSYEHLHKDTGLAVDTIKRYIDEFSNHKN